MISVSVSVFSAPSAFPDVQTYDQLLAAIRSVQSASQERVTQVVENEKVREVWETGKLIDTHLLENRKRADYGEKVLKRLSHDMGTSETELYYFLRFARAYPILPSTVELELPWGHYRELLSLTDPDERKELSEEAVRKHWTQGELRREIRKRRASQQGSSPRVSVAELPDPTPGKPYTYQAVKTTEGPHKGELALDLGFLIFIQPDKINRFKAGDIVSVGAPLVGAQKGRAQGPPLQLLKDAADADLYAYNAYVIEIIDGDSVPRKTAQEMRVGPSEPICGNGFQSALSGFG